MKDKNWIYRQESDICMLHLFESFMGAAPQLILQLYIMAVLRYTPLWTSKRKYKIIISIKNLKKEIKAVKSVVEIIIAQIVLIKIIKHNYLSHFYVYYYS